MKDDIRDSEAREAGPHTAKNHSGSESAETGKNAEIDRMMEDLASIRRAVEKHRPLLREIASPAHFKALALYYGTALIVWCGVWQVLIVQYGSYGSIPEIARILLIGIAIFAMTLGAVVKLSVIGTTARQVRPEYRLGRVLGEYFSDSVARVQVPTMVVLAAVSVFLAVKGLSWYILPLLSFGYGGFASVLGSLLGARHYSIVGYWNMAMAAICLPFLEAAPFVWLAISFGLGLLLFGFTISGKRR